jgi:hypothetical protein
VKGSEKFALIVRGLDDHSTEHDPFLEIDGFAAISVGDEQVFVQFLVSL